MNVDTYQTVYKDPSYYCGPGPSVVCDPATGRLTLVFRRVKSWLSDGLAGHWHPGTETCITHSDDLGENWSQPRIFLSGWQCPCLTRLRDGALLHSSHRFELVSPEIASGFDDIPGKMTRPWPGIHGGTAIHRSTDEGISWTEPVWLGGVPGIEPFHSDLQMPVAVRGNILETRGGKLLLSAYGLRPGNTAYLFGSTDDGVSWTFESTIAEGFNETYLFETPGEDLLAWMRAEGDRMPDLYVARSSDGGKTWSVPELCHKGYPAACAAFGSGNLLLTYGYRFEDGHGVRARMLSSEGPDSTDEHIIRDDGAVSDLGYPHAVSLPDGRVFVVYYINRKTDADDRTAPRYIESCIVSE